jgi:hypothetical protein
MRKEKKIVNYKIETCRRVLISTPLYQVRAGVNRVKVHCAAQHMVNAGVNRVTVERLVSTKCE